MAVEEGKAAPLFTLKDQTGGKVSLKDLRGQNVIVYFYPKDDTPGCTKQAIGFTALDKEFKKLNTLVLGVSPDDEASHDKFICKYNIPYTLLCDTDKKVMTKYGAYGEKMMYGKKTIGVIRSTVWVDEKGKVKRHWRRVPKAADHPQKVLEAIQAATD
ncbi:MAG TPA: peroxiredoxin [Planctomycetaceae bacterium]|jgi:peroxiredoxin Q/BCP|nr:peroxiredoxin [Rhodopirellula sp.]MCH2359914.1 peroxiredoxin [Pirellulales bacterium]HAL14933.1 peroxiredoxin [Planctomycetaceae bacterium]HCK72182.1 peroxiredoxin [Planctomycetaceae bacterium]HCP84094.1 peroxiredoxin [Planctomycetaceae bacterium]|tara:strand:+ start:1779 stop:2252 length:474 start_codon:yes stop_codon:yes gene_type:complete